MTRWGGSGRPAGKPYEWWRQTGWEPIRLRSGQACPTKKGGRPGGNCGAIPALQNGKRPGQKTKLLPYGERQTERQTGSLSYQERRHCGRPANGNGRAHSCSPLRRPTGWKPVPPRRGNGPAGEARPGAQLCAPTDGRGTGRGRGRRVGCGAKGVEVPRLRFAPLGMTGGGRRDSSVPSE